MNLRHIISKTSLKSSSLKNREQFMDEKSKVMHEIELLKDSVQYLNNSLENQDEAVKTLSNEKEKLYLELKSVQRINRNLKQQLDDEREIHFKEKEYLIGEIMKCTKNQAPIDKDLKFNNVRSYHEETTQDNSYNILQQQLNIKDEVIYTICSKYMKISYAKKCMQKRICFLQHQTQEMCQNIIFLLQENQETLNKLINKLLIFSKLSPGKKYLHDLQSYGNLHYENMQLKIAILSYKTNTFLDETKCRKGTSITDYTTFSKSDARIKNYLNFNGQLMPMNKWKRFKRSAVRYSNLTQVLRSKSDSCLVFSRYDQYSVYQL